VELVLNLLWVLISAAAVYGWMGRPHDCPRRRDLLRDAMVLGCILWLLFPIISASDDLCVNSDAVEEWTSFSRRTKVSPSPALSTGAFVALPVSLVAVLVPALALLGLVIADSLPIPSSVLVRREHGRSPPALSLA
jgi:hypothetical protein